MTSRKNSSIRNPLVHIDGVTAAHSRKPSTRFKISKPITTTARGNTRSSKPSSTKRQLNSFQKEYLFDSIEPGSLPETCCMTELDQIFAALGISQYLEDFRSQGFDTWDTILDITESDFDALGVKLGHRRKLQRKIANARGISSDRALGSPPRNTAADDREEKPMRVEGKESGGSGTQKRKYKRHPKPDANAPDRPPSAYVIFSNKMRRDIDGQNLSFTEIAKLVGENWQALQPHEKEPYEQQANSQKEAYISAMTEYKKTQNFREYDQYLKEFKTKQSSNQQQASTDTDAKRPKLEPHPSHGSGGTTSSGNSQHGGEIPSGRMHESSPTGQWGDSRGQGSPIVASSGALPGYRDTILAPVQHTLAWRDGQRDENGLPQLSQQFPRMGYPGQHGSGSPGLTAPNQFPRRAANSSLHNPTPPPPPLLSSESTAGSTSTTSSAYYSPRTPMETHNGPPLPYFTQKATGSYENQLPPLQTPSISPQNTNIGSLQSPNSAQSYQTLPPVRELYTPTAGYEATRSREVSKDNLDILAKAAELANQKQGGTPR